MRKRARKLRKDEKERLLNYVNYFLIGLVIIFIALQLLSLSIFFDRDGVQDMENVAPGTVLDADSDGTDGILYLNGIIKDMNFDFISGNVVKAPDLEVEGLEETELIEFGAYIEYEDDEDGGHSDYIKSTSVEIIGSNPPRNIPPERYDVLFSSGRGTANQDKDAYMDYESAFYFTPTYDMEINTIEPDVFLCLEECYYTVEIFDELGNKLGEGNSKGTNAEDLNGRLSEDVALKAGSNYKIIQHISSTKTAGIYTAGRFDVSKNNGKYEVIYSKSVYYVDYKNRGPISFKIIGILKDTAEYESASWVCKKTSTLRHDESVIYEFTDFKKHAECKNKEEWLSIAGRLCNSLCDDEECRFDVKEVVYGDLCE